MTIIPGLMGICTYSPPLDSYGNSSRGVQFMNELSNQFSLHLFRVEKTNSISSRKQNCSFELLDYCAEGDLNQVKRMVLQSKQTLLGDQTICKGDYDGRTALHLAASEGHLTVVQYLVES